MKSKTEHVLYRKEENNTINKNKYYSCFTELIIIMIKNYLYVIELILTGGGHGHGSIWIQQANNPLELLACLRDEDDSTKKSKRKSIAATGRESQWA